MGANRIGWPDRAAEPDPRIGDFVELLKTGEFGKIVWARRGRMPGNEVFLVRIKDPAPGRVLEVVALKGELRVQRAAV